MSARRPPGGYVKRPPLTPEESEIAHEVAAHVGDLRAEGVCWDCVLIDIDKTWPRLAYRVAITALFLAQLAHERRQQKAALQ